MRQKFFYTRKELSLLLVQPRKLRKNTYTHSHPSIRSISLILRALAEVIGEFGLNEMQRDVPKRYVKALCDDEILEKDKVTAIKFLATSGKVSFRAIPLIQYVLDNSDFCFLDGKEALINWLREPIHQSWLCSTYRVLLGQLPTTQQLPKPTDNPYTVGYDGTIDIHVFESVA